MPQVTHCQRSNLLLLAIIVGSCLDMALPSRCESVVCSTLLLPYLQLSTSTEVAAGTGVAAAAAGRQQQLLLLSSNVVQFKHAV